MTRSPITNSVDAYQRLSDVKAVVRKAVGSLYIAVAEEVADDVRDKVEAAFAAYEKYAEARRNEA